MEDPTPDYTYVDAKTQEACCPICSTRKKLTIPSAVEDFVEELRKFGREHAGCRADADERWHEAVTGA